MYGFNIMASPGLLHILAQYTHIEQMAKHQYSLMLIYVATKLNTFDYRVASYDSLVIA